MTERPGRRALSRAERRLLDPGLVPVLVAWAKVEAIIKAAAARPAARCDLRMECFSKLFAFE
jgi:hypothetical protein